MLHFFGEQRLKMPGIMGNGIHQCLNDHPARQQFGVIEMFSEAVPQIFELRKFAQLVPDADKPRFTGCRHPLRAITLNALRQAGDGFETQEKQGPTDRITRRLPVDQERPAAHPRPTRQNPPACCSSPPSHRPAPVHATPNTCELRKICEIKC